MSSSKWAQKSLVLHMLVLSALRSHSTQAQTFQPSTGIPALPKNPAATPWTRAPGRPPVHSTVYNDGQRAVVGGKGGTSIYSACPLHGPEHFPSILYGQNPKNVT